MHTYVCTYVYTYMYTYICTYIHTSKFLLEYNGATGRSSSFSSDVSVKLFKKRDSYKSYFY